MVVVAQLVRVLVCGAEGRRFEPGQPPIKQKSRKYRDFFCFSIFYFPSLSTTGRFSALASSHAITKASCVLFANASNSILSTSSVFW